MDTPPSKPRREAKVDLTGLSPDEIEIRRAVVELGSLAFGTRWQTDLAASLSNSTGRKIGQAQVSHWISGHRPVPRALIEPLRALAMRVAVDLEAAAKIIRADWKDL